MRHSGLRLRKTIRPTAYLADPTQVATPIPSLIATLQVSVESKVSKGDKLLMTVSCVAAAKQDGSDACALRSLRRSRENTVYAPCDGVVAELHVALADTVEAKDLLIKIRVAS